MIMAHPKTTSRKVASQAELDPRRRRVRARAVRPASYSFCTTSIVSATPSFNRTAAACCSVDVVNGASGFRTSSSDRTERTTPLPAARTRSATRDATASSQLSLAWS